MKNYDLTKGSITKSIILFSIPLLIGNLFQQLYNTVDSYVVGNYVNQYALAAVGASTPIINILIGFFMGISTGAGVVIAQYYGAKDRINLKKAINNSLILTIIMGIILTAIGLSFTNGLLHLIGVPQKVFKLSSKYLSIYFSGILFTLIYNMSAGILRAVGDSKRPLLFLMFSSVINIILDFLFVKELKMGVSGVAIATLISQFISAILVVYVLLRTKEVYQVKLKDIRFDQIIMKKIIQIGLPAGLQQGIIPLSNVIVQSYINPYGAFVIAGYSIGVRIDGFVLLPLQAFNMAITTYVGQNMGAKKYERVKKGAYLTWLIATIIILVFIGLMYMFGISFIGLFNQDKEVIQAGWIMMSTFLPFYPLMVINQVVTGVLRGKGDSKGAMYITLLNFVILRQGYLYFITKLTNSLRSVFFAWPFTWISCVIMFFIYSIFNKRRKENYYESSNYFSNRK
ncbi:MAG: MATE family efflux transporter [Bacillota bacterium]|nr:MATE family efflux transporter [Bacillota bacterium]